MNTIDDDQDEQSALPGYPRPLWITQSYRAAGPTTGCLRCQATTEPGMTERERFDFELLHSLCPAPQSEPAA